MTVSRLRISSLTRAGWNRQLRSNRANQASTALFNVRSRHDELLRVEESITQLAELFRDFEVLVFQQGKTVEFVEQQAEEVNVNLERGTKLNGQAIQSLEAARRKKWIMLGLVVLIICVIVCVLLLGLCFGTALIDGGVCKNR